MSTNKPTADIADFVYGPNWRNTFDVWLAKAASPSPLFVYIHQNGFVAGDKSLVPESLINTLLPAGISVASINYRLSQQAPFPAAYMDCARAIQMLRYFAPAWNIDPSRVAAGGCSAGGGASLWLAFHDDLADLTASDPVARLSTRLTCTSNISAQCSYDPHFIRELVPGEACEHEMMPLFFGLPREEFDTPRARALFKAAAAIELVNERSVPALMFHERADEPADGRFDKNVGIHHIRFGLALQKRMAQFGRSCTVKTSADYPDAAKGEGFTLWAQETLAFLRTHFGM